MQCGKLVTLLASLFSVALWWGTPASAATTTIPASAFEPMYSYPYPDYQVGHYLSTLSVITTLPYMVDFQAPVRLPAGSRITRVRMWYYKEDDTSAVSLRFWSSRWGTTDFEWVATIDRTPRNSEMTVVGTTDILRPEVARTDRLFLLLTMGGSCFFGGVKIDYEW